MDDDKDSKSETISAGMPPLGAPRSDPRPTDLQVFFMLLPSVIGGLAGKNDIRSTNSTAFVLVREALGQCAVMGTLRASFVCLDGSMLASMPNNAVPMGVQSPMQQAGNPGGGGGVVQYPNQPGQGQPAQSQAGVGGMVSQYPNQPPPYAGNQQPNYGGGSRGVMVAQFPNGTTPPQL